MSHPNIEVRNVRFKTEKSVPKYWHPKGRAVTIFFNNLSILFPEGERFFIHSVKHFAKVVKDPQLQKEVRAFMGQEAMHTREHEGYNDMLEAQGYSAKEIERSVTALLNLVMKYLPKRVQLSATVALEHWTAVLANILLERPELVAGADSEMAELWRWHAAEETEHKAVAFDVYKAAGANYPERAVVQLIATFFFQLKILEQQARMMNDDGILFNSKEWASLVAFLYLGKAPMLKVYRGWLSYFRPGFHPWDQDNRQLLAAWRDEYEKKPRYRKAS
jgi:predicted metal-dependent hydrolase